jgi:hypothetical protein
MSVLQVMMLNDRIQSVGRLQSVLTKAEEHLSKLPADTPYSEFSIKLVCPISFSCFDFLLKHYIAFCMLFVLSKISSLVGLFEVLRISKKSI